MPKEYKNLDNPADNDDDVSVSSQDIDLKPVHGTRKPVVGIDEKKGQQFDVEGQTYNSRFGLDEILTDKRKILIRAAAGEFLVTTLFLFIVCAVGLNLERSGHATSEALVVGALSTGFASVALIYSFADVSGAHFNPAVTVATIVTGKTSLAKGSIYIIAQLLASLFAMVLLVLAFPRVNDSISIPQELVVVPAENVSWGHAFVMEFILSFILVYVIFAVAFDTVQSNTAAVRLVDERGNPVNPTRAKNLTIYTANGNSKAGFAPLSIGLTLGFLCFLGGSVSGGAFNPARVFGPGFCSGGYKNHWSSMWLYWLADCLGASLAGIVQQTFFATKPADSK